MSLITIDDDSSDEVAVDINAEDSPDDDATNTNEELSTGRSLGIEVVTISMDEGSCDVTIEAAETNKEPEDKPILELMKHLINYNGKQNTTLTNAQLIGILKNEFDINVTNLHDLTIDIYMNVLKKFLKEWPRWDEFDQIMHESRCMNDSEEVEMMLESEYKSLKIYLATMLNVCKPFAREVTQSAKRTLAKQNLSTSSTSGSNDVVLEVNCTRNQLNTLFFRKPHPDLENTIFNIDGSVPSRINIQNLTLKSILNWGYIRVTVNLNCLKYKRELVHNFKHTLINKKLHQSVDDILLNRHLQMSKNSKAGYVIYKKTLKFVADKTLHTMRCNPDQKKDLEAILQTINEDVSIFEGDLNALAVYRHYLNPYPYVRYLYEDVNTESDKYDLQLQEMVSPRLIFSVTKLCSKTSAVGDETGWLKLECTFCNLNFVGFEGITQLKNHFKDEHQNEPDWMCSYCEQTFTAMHLALSRWYHQCSSTYNYINIV